MTMLANRAGVQPDADGNNMSNVGNVCSYTFSAAVGREEYRYIFLSEGIHHPFFQSEQSIAVRNTTGLGSSFHEGATFYRESQLSRISPDIEISSTLGQIFVPFVTILFRLKPFNTGPV